MNKTGASFQSKKFSVERVEEAYMAVMEELSRVLCELVSRLCDDGMVTSGDLETLNSLHSELRYHDRMKHHAAQDGVSQWVEEALMSLKAKCQEFPKIKQINQGQLATIAEKYSEENLLSNYIRQQKPKRTRHTMNDGKKEVHREETRRSLDNPPHQKPLYFELERMKGKEPDMKMPESRRFVIKSKLPLYNISKLI